MVTPSKPKTTIDIEEDWPNVTHSDEEDEAPQHQRDYKHDVKELEERVKTKDKAFAKIKLSNARGTSL
ncbi:hypothetical protein R3I94_005056 [Phoxinus phoxinus]